MKRKWYCLIQGKELGPFSGKEVRELALKGKLLPNDLIRTADSQSWVFAEQVSGIEFASNHPADRTSPEVNRSQTAAPPPLPPEIGRPTGIPNEAVGHDLSRAFVSWRRAIARSRVVVVSCAALIGTVLLVVWIVQATSQSKQIPTNSAQPANAANNQSATITYWRSVRQIIATLKADAAAFATASRQLRSLRVMGVDEDAMQCALQASRVFQDVADADQYLTSADFLAYSFVEGANGRPFQGFQQGQNIRQDVYSRLRDVVFHIQETEAVLSHRYNVDFMSELK